MEALQGNLRCTASAVQTIEEAKVLIRALESAIGNKNSLSAPEVGTTTAIAIIRTPEFSIDLINPIILVKEVPVLSFGEQCFSFPGKTLNCIRYNHIILRNGLKGDPLELTGCSAILAQHQIDHLQGIVFQDRAIKVAEVHENGFIGLDDFCPCGNKKSFARCCMLRV